MSVPAFIEVEPDRFEPTDQCSREQLEAAAEAMMVHALMAAQEAVEQADREGVSVMSNETMETSTRLHDDAEALLRYAMTRA